MRAAVCLAAVALAVPCAAAQVSVEAAGGHVRIEAQRAKLVDVLKAFADETGLDVIYDGSPPSLTVTASIDDVSSARALVRLFEGHGLNYALVTDAGGASAITLLVAEKGSGTAPRSPPPAPRREVPAEPPPTAMDPAAEEPDALPEPAAPEPPRPPVFDPVKPLQQGPAVPLRLPQTPTGGEAADTQQPGGMSREEVLRLRLQQLRENRRGADPEDEQS